MSQILVHQSPPQRNPVKPSGALCFDGPVWTGWPARCCWIVSSLYDVALIPSEPNCIICPKKRFNYRCFLCFIGQSIFWNQQNTVIGQYYYFIQQLACEPTVGYMDTYRECRTLNQNVFEGQTMTRCPISGSYVGTVCSVLQKVQWIANWVESSKCAQSLGDQRWGFALWESVSIIV